jgi:Ca2+-binding EF-hand superfamily protein
MKGLGISISREECKRMFDELDEDGSGVLELNEYMKLMRSLMLNSRNVRYEV